MTNESNPFHCAGYGPWEENKITLSLDVTEKEYGQLQENEIFFAVTIDDEGNLDIEKFVADDYPAHLA